MTYQDFDASFGEGARAEEQDLASVPVPNLLLRVKVGDLGTHYQHRHPDRALERVQAELQRRLGAAFEDPTDTP